MDDAVYDDGGKRAFSQSEPKPKNTRPDQPGMLKNYFDCKDESDALQTFHKYAGTIEAIAIEQIENGEEIPLLTAGHF